MCARDTIISNQLVTLAFNLCIVPCIKAQDDTEFGGRRMTQTSVGPKTSTDTNFDFAITSTDTNNPKC